MAKVLLIRLLKLVNLKFRVKKMGGILKEHKGAVHLASVVGSADAQLGPK